MEEGQHLTLVTSSPLSNSYFLTWPLAEGQPLLYSDETTELPLVTHTQRTDNSNQLDAYAG